MERRRKEVRNGRRLAARMVDGEQRRGRDERRGLESSTGAPGRGTGEELGAEGAGEGGSSGQEESRPGARAAREKEEEGDGDEGRRGAAGRAAGRPAQGGEPAGVGW